MATGLDILQIGGSGNGRIGEGDPLCFADRDWLALGRRLGLSPQRVRIARLIADEDLQVKEIARRLNRAKRSVTMQLERMYQKLHIRSRAALVARLWRAERQLRHEH